MRSLLLDAVIALGIALAVTGILAGNLFAAAGGVEPSTTNVVRIVVVAIIVFAGLRIARAVRRRRA